MIVMSYKVQTQHGSPMHEDVALTVEVFGEYARVMSVLDEFRQSFQEIRNEDV